jgi:hypothetical protein
VEQPDELDGQPGRHCDLDFLQLNTRHARAHLPLQQVSLASAFTWAPNGPTRRGWRSSRCSDRERHLAAASHWSRDCPCLTVATRRRTSSRNSAHAQDESRSARRRGPVRLSPVVIPRRGRSTYVQASAGVREDAIPAPPMWRQELGAAFCVRSERRRQAVASRRRWRSSFGARNSHRPDTHLVR